MSEKTKKPTKAEESKKTTQAESHQFKTEVSQLLHLMIHSLYSNKEIFLRELLSNASDACEKLRFEALSNQSAFGDSPDLEIKLDFDKDNKILSIEDSGVGMSREDVINNIGTIAHSGTLEFLQKAKENNASFDNSMIGQFGVGFYSSFMVADKVELETRRFDMPAEQAVRWTSEGKGEFSLETINKATRGTCIRLHLNEEGAKEFLTRYSLVSLITKYSNYLPVPILMRKEVEVKEEEKTITKLIDEWEKVNSSESLWTRDKKEISEEEYTQFYTNLSYDTKAPVMWQHIKVDGKFQYTALLYLPESVHNSMMYDASKVKHGLKLYVQRIFIMDHAHQFLPAYLRFFQGLIDSNDLPLNVSREMLQHSSVSESIKNQLTRRILDACLKMAQDEPEKYLKVWNAYELFFREGLFSDFREKENLLKLFRFTSTLDKDSKKLWSFADYIARIKGDSKEIYCLVADSYDAAMNNPHLEYYLKNNLEVVILTQRMDEWLFSSVREVDNYSLVDISKASEKSKDEKQDSEDKATKEAKAKEWEAVTTKLKVVLGDKVEAVTLSDKLVGSPACITMPQFAMSHRMQQMFQSLEKDSMIPQHKPNLEINPEHKICLKLQESLNHPLFDEIAKFLFDQALMVEGSLPENPGEFVKRVNDLVQKAF